MSPLNEARKNEEKRSTPAVPHMRASEKFEVRSEALKLSLGRGPYGEDLRAKWAGKGGLGIRRFRRRVHSTECSARERVTVRLPAGIWVRPASVTK